MDVHIIAEAPGAIGPYCHATQVGKLVFCSGQTPLDPRTMQLVGATIEEQTEQALLNLTAVLNGLGLSLRECGQDDGVSEGYGGFSGHEWGLCAHVWRAQAGADDDCRQAEPAGRTGGDRMYRRGAVRPRPGAVQRHTMRR